MSSSGKEDKRVDFEFESADDKQAMNIWRTIAGVKWKDWLPHAARLWAWVTGIQTDEEMGMDEAKKKAILDKLQKTPLSGKAFIFLDKLFLWSLNPKLTLVATPKELETLYELSVKRVEYLRRILKG